MCHQIPRHHCTLIPLVHTHDCSKPGLAVLVPVNKAYQTVVDYRLIRRSHRQDDDSPSEKQKIRKNVSISEGSRV